jgi:hypothetical protein
MILDINKCLKLIKICQINNYRKNIMMKILDNKVWKIWKHNFRIFKNRKLMSGMIMKMRMVLMINLKILNLSKTRRKEDWRNKRTKHKKSLKSSLLERISNKRILFRINNKLSNKKWKMNNSKAINKREKVIEDSMVKTPKSTRTPINPKKRKRPSSNS